MVNYYRIAINYRSKNQDVLDIKSNTASWHYAAENGARGNLSISYYMNTGNVHSFFNITGLVNKEIYPQVHEGKITGLAAHGNPMKAIDLMRKMITVKQGKLRSNLGDYYKPFFSSYFSFLICL